MRAESRRRTSNGPRPARGIRGTRTWWPIAWPTSWTAPSPQCGPSPSCLACRCDAPPARWRWSGSPQPSRRAACSPDISGAPRRATPGGLPASVDPLLEMGALGTDRRVGAVAGQDQDPGAEAGEKAFIEGLHDGLEVAAGELRPTGTAREQGVAAEQQRAVFEIEAHRSRRVPRGGDGPELELPHLDEGVVLEQQVIGGEHFGV